LTLLGALIGKNKKKGASVEVATPGSAMAYEVAKIDWR
jgi:transcription elongation GreA/GreB family factor